MYMNYVLSHTLSVYLSVIPVLGAYPSVNNREQL